MKKWLLAWVVFTLYLIANMTVMPTAEQPHLVATLLLGFFFYLIFGIRGVYFAMLAVAGIVVLAVLVHQFRHPHYGFSFYGEQFIRLLLDLITIMGGGGIGYWVDRLLHRRST
ncbi:hypothetical protein [Tumebacillus flagellatus]|uniref:Uncharacterized protein n=1 Tax=Tumebacillus flagellatus TaxID=1157490 RepID=A0A074LQQ2_9BACL|nr:hypothetical protein [Tumebacillus flagellatus]KEO84466.1 hypothetical protein EL26_05035 [Tumebacillus flagellatus]